MQSQNETGDQHPLFSYGMHFCPLCKNLMRPYHGTGSLLDFICDRCSKKQTVDYTNRENDQCLLYSKELQAGSRKHVADLAYIFDPTMPIVDVECPQCGHNKAVYMLTPDQGETKMIAVMICASAVGTVAKCGHSWVLDETSELTATKVITEQERFFQNIA